MGKMKLLKDGSTYLNVDHIVRFYPSKFGTDIELTNGKREFYPREVEKFLELLEKQADAVKIIAR